MERTPRNKRNPYQLNRTKWRERYKTKQAEIYNHSVCVPLQLFEEGRKRKKGGGKKKKKKKRKIKKRKTHMRTVYVDMRESPNAMFRNSAIKSNLVLLQPKNRPTPFVRRKEKGNLNTK